ncbi:hypothetical protein AAG906_007095 [Vitis piasezkii]
MQQQPPQMMNIAPSFPPTAITTEQIQKYLDENKQLILAILENQNLGKLAECAQYQAQLQKNLIYLAAIADAQPPAPTVPPQVEHLSYVQQTLQMPIHHAMQQGHYMQHPQAAAAQQQPGMFGAKLPFQLSDQQQQQQHHLLHLQQQQPIQGLMGMRPIINNGMHQAMQTGLASQMAQRLVLVMAKGSLLLDMAVEIEIPKVEDSSNYDSDDIGANNANIQRIESFWSHTLNSERERERERERELQFQQCLSFTSV